MTCASPTQTMEVSATDLRWECPAPDKMDDIGAEELSGIASGTQDVNGRVFASSSTSKLAPRPARGMLTARTQDCVCTRKYSNLIGG